MDGKPLIQLFNDEIRAIVVKYSADAELTNAEAIGVLEQILFNLKMNVREQEKSDEPF